MKFERKWHTPVIRFDEVLQIEMSRREAQELVRFIRAASPFVRVQAYNQSLFHELSKFAEGEEE